MNLVDDGFGFPNRAFTLVLELTLPKRDAQNAPRCGGVWKQIRTQRDLEAWKTASKRYPPTSRHAIFRKLQIVFPKKPKSLSARAL